MTPERGIRLAEGALVILLAVALADLTWDLAPGPQPGVTAYGDKGSGVVSETAPSRPQTNRPIGSVQDLFGSAPDQEKNQAASQPVRETRLKLTLTGVLTRQGRPEQRLALIAREGAEEKVYREGDRIEGARIVRIEPRRVILLRNGVTEALNLEVEEADTSAASGAARTPQGGGIQRTGEHKRLVSRETLDRKLENLPRLLRQAKAVPYEQDGQRLGFKVVNIQEGSVFEDLGIKQGDVIQAVNGQAIRRPKQALQAYRELRNSKRFKVDVLRDGQPVSLEYSVQ
jgi:general secretion pathway protein C